MSKRFEYVQLQKSQEVSVGRFQHWGLQMIVKYILTSSAHTIKCSKISDKRWQIIYTHNWPLQPFSQDYWPSFSFIKRVNSSGPKWLPCGTPYSTPIKIGCVFLNLTHCFLFTKYDFIQFSNDELKPSRLSLWTSKLWFTLSNALLYLCMHGICRLELTLNCRSRHSRIKLGHNTDWRVVIMYVCMHGIKN